MKKLIVLLLVVFWVSCGKDEEMFPNEVFEVTTAGIGIDCGLVLIDFKEADLGRIEKLGRPNWLRYHAYNLDRDKFSETGQVLTVRVRRTFDTELRPCTTLGPGYPWVTVLEASIQE